MLRLVLAAVLVACLPKAAHAEDILLSIEPLPDPWEFRIAGGVNYSSGDYGGAGKTQIIALPLSLRTARGPVSLGVSIPWVRLEGPGSLVEADGGTLAGGSSAAPLSGLDVAPGADRRVTSGFGDLTATLGYALDLGGGTYLDVAGKLKLPTASVRKRLGTGKVDLTAVVDLTHDFGVVAVYAEARRRFAGDTRRFPVRDTWGWTAGASYRVSDSTALGLDFDWQQASFEGGTPMAELTGWANLRAAERLRIQLFGTAGLNDNSVDVAAGVGVSWRFELD